MISMTTCSPNPAESASGGVSSTAYFKSVSWFSVLNAFIPPYSTTQAAGHPRVRVLTIAKGVQENSPRGLEIEF